MRKKLLQFSAMLILLSVFVNHSQVTGNTRTDPGELPQKKEHTLKVLVKSNGQLIEKDTVVVIKSGRALALSGGAVAAGEDTIIMVGEGKEQGKRMLIFVNDGEGHPGKDSVTVNCIYIAGDSLRRAINPDVLSPEKIRRMVIMQNGAGQTFDVAGSQPGVRATAISAANDPFEFDAADPDIVSYKKKDLGKGQEKIIIVRKKRDPKKEVREMEVKVVK